MSKRVQREKRVGICVMCGEPLTGFRSHKRTCSDKCRKAKERWLKAKKVNLSFKVYHNGKEVQW